MRNFDSNQAIRRFVQGFSEAFSESLSGAAGHTWKVTVPDDSTAPEKAGSPLVFRLTMEGALRGEFFLEFYEPQVRELAAVLCGHAVETIGNEEEEALKNAISSAITKHTGSLSAEYGTVSGNVERVANPVLTDMNAIGLVSKGKADSLVPATIYLDGKLVESLSSGADAANTAEAGKPRIDPVNLNLVMDVELSMSLRFGRRQLPLREVLELASGSVVELDRQVDDPVELLLDGRVIARGEAVIVDGNYGLRVTEITEPIASNFVR
jgi:flagellar motor switch protein FliN/FliY